MITKGMFTSLTPEWATPQALYNALDAEFNFKLDPCATDENHKAPIYYTKEQDGLKQDWGTMTAFINPPYGRTIGQWVKKAYEHANRGGWPWLFCRAVPVLNGGIMSCWRLK